MKFSQQRIQNLTTALRVALGLLVLTLFSTLGIVRANNGVDDTGETAPQTTIETAWRLAHAVGRYNFATAIEQTTTPAASLSNVGRGPRQETLYIEGKNDTPAKQMEMHIWQNGGSLIDKETALAVRIAGQQAFVRRPQGQWEAVDEFSGFIAPNNDPLIFLAAVKNADRGALANHFTFDLDSAAFAEIVRAEMEAALQEKGELPPGVQLETNALYRQMQAQGELWLDEEGLPQRMQLQLALPEQANGDRVEATIQSDFRNFDRARLAAQATWPVRLSQALSLPQTADGWRTLAGGWLLFSGFSLFTLLVIRYRRAHRFYTGVAISVIVSLLVTPLLQTQRLYAFSAKMEARYASDQATASAPPPQEAAPQLPAAAASPNTELATAAQLAQTTDNSGPDNNGPDSDQDGVSDQLEAHHESNPNDSDSDDDGLSDEQEILKLGTDPIVNDSDGDGLTDPKEVNGFVLNGQTLFSDPRQPDTNRDGLLDGLDCAGQSKLLASSPSPCPDSDNDGTLDLFDDDNDGDGVPDAVDLSPMHTLGSANAAFTSANPFKLNVSDYAANQPLYLDLQLRTVNPAHLTYALNVLDWPDDDVRGQIQRRLNTTFKTTNNAQIRTADQHAGNGDVRVIPMLSIRIPVGQGATGNLPLKPGATPYRIGQPILEWIATLDSEQLNAYNMTVRAFDETTLEILAPVYMQPNATGDGRVAFGAHLLYWPNSPAWGAAHELRLVWLVQMITDECIDKNWEGHEYCHLDQHRADKVTILHAYEDDWFLTGIKAEEQLGLDVAVVRGDVSKSVDPTLWHLGHGLANTFASGSDSDNNNQRDLTVTEIAERWQQNSTRDANQRWQIPVGATDVKKFRYAHSDEYAKIMMSELRGILSAFPTTVTPTLLIARERKLRNTGLGEAAVNGNTITLKFGNQALGEFVQKPKILADVLWASYRHDGQQWTNYNPVEYLNHVLQPTLAADPAFQPADNSVSAQTDARLLADILKSLYLILLQGQGGLVWHGGTTITATAAFPEARVAQSEQNNLAAIAHTYKPLFKTLGLYYSTRNLIRSYAYARYGSGVHAALILGTVIVVEATGADRSIALGVTAGLNIAIGTMYSVRMVQLYQRAQLGLIGPATQKAAAAATELNIATRGLSTASKGFVLSIAIAWGTYIAIGAMTNDWGSPYLLASTAATMVVAVALLLIALALGPIIGTVAALSLLLFDAFALLICESADLQGAICGGVTGMLAGLIVQANDYVEMDDPNRLTIESVNVALDNTNAGFTVGNKLYFIANVVTALKPAGNPQRLEDKVRRSTFVYSLDETERDLHGQLHQFGMYYRWQFNPQTGRYAYRSQQFRELALNRIGINAAFPLYLNEGFYILYEECQFGICQDKNVADSNHLNLSAVAIYDILPASFAAFYQLTANLDGSYRLQWQDQGQLAAPTLLDADGDGLLTQARGGSDLDDSTWDVDHDGLTDRAEYERGSNPTQGDSDGDGLGDAQEVRYGTNPNRSDSDYDTLSDLVEVQGWQHFYGYDGLTPLRTWVRSDPLAIDSDGDDLYDGEEKRLGYHPGAPFAYLPLTYAAAVRNPNLPSQFASDTLYAKPGDTLYYDADVANNLADRQIYGQLTTRADAGLTTDSNPQSFFLLPSEQTTRTHPIFVQANAAPGVNRVGQLARGYVDDAQRTSQAAVAYYSFDNARPLIDLSGSLPAVPVACNSNACPTLVASGKIERAMHFGGDDYLTADGVAAELSNPALSIGGWVYPQSPAPAQFSTFWAFHAANGDSQNTLSYDSSNQRFVYSDSTVTQASSQTFEVNRWHYVMTTIASNGSGLVYINGRAQITFTTAVRPTAQSRFSLGQEWDGNSPSDLWNGRLDEIKIYKRALSAEEAVQAMEVIEPVYELSFDQWQESAPGSNGKNFFSPNNSLIATCPNNSPGCPEIFQTPWGGGAKSGNGVVTIQLKPPADSFSPGVPLDLTHGKLSIALRLFPQSGDVNGTYFFQDIGTIADGHADGMPSLAFDNNGRLIARFDNFLNRYVSAPVLQFNTWQQIVATFDGNLLALYVNGQPVGATTIFAGLEEATPDPYIDLGVGYFGSDEDELQIYDYALTANQIEQLFSADSYSDLHLRFEDPPGATRFANVGKRGADAYCSAGACPLADVPGRNGQAARFVVGQPLIVNHRAQQPMVQTTVAAWVKGTGEIVRRNADGNGGSLIFSSSGISLSVRNGTSSTPQVESRSLLIPAHLRPPADQWVHLAATFSGVLGGYFDSQNNNVFVSYSQIHLYLNGQEVAVDSNGPIGSLIASTQPLTVGNSFQGDLDDVRLYRLALSPAEVQQLYHASAPALWLRLDEEEGDTSFENSPTSDQSVSCTSCPRGGNPGRLGQSAWFSSTDLLYAGADFAVPFGHDAPFSFGLWLKSETVKGTVETILQQGHPTSNGSLVALTLQGDIGSPNNTLFYDFRPNSTDSVQISATVRAGVWYHLFATFDGDKTRLYLNGTLVGEGGSGLNPNPHSGAILLGASRLWIIDHWVTLSYFTGYLDEVHVYRSALSAQEIQRLYETQLNWTEAFSRFEVTVDSDAPTTTIRSNVIYRPNLPTILDVYADDPTTPLQSVELLVNNQATSAPPCQDAVGDAAWCPTFSPSGEGAYLLQSRATDLVGHQTTSQPLNVLVDATPPTITINHNEGALLAATKSLSIANQWLLPLQGTVSDPNLLSGQMGSGVQRLLVTLFNSEGAPVGSGTMAAMPGAGGLWQLDYPLDSAPAGNARLEVVAIDTVGNRHSQSIALRFDNLPPALQLATQLASGVSPTISNSLPISGTVSDLLPGNTISEIQPGAGVQRVEIAYQPSEIGSTFYNEALPLAVTYYEPAEGLEPFAATEEMSGSLDIAGNDILTICEGAACPLVVAHGIHQQAFSFAGSQYLRANDVAGHILSSSFSVGAWVNPQVSAPSEWGAIWAFNGSNFTDQNRLSFNSTTGRFGYFDDRTHAESNSTYALDRWYHVMTTIDADGNGLVYINGQAEISFTTPLRPVASSYFSIGQEWDGENQPSELWQGLIDDIQVFSYAAPATAVQQVMRGSQPVLRLDFEDDWVTDGEVIRDHSGYQRGGVLASGDVINKSVVGGVGSNALAFDGVDDQVVITGHPALDLSHGRFSQALWVYPMGDNSGERVVFGYQPDGDVNKAYPGLSLVDGTRIKFGFGTGLVWRGAVTDPVLVPNTWNFIVLTFEIGADGNGIYHVYRNGALVHSNYGFLTLRPYPTAQVTLGALGMGFGGKLDELRIYPRTLSGDEITMLYRQGWQAVALNVNTTPATWQTTVANQVEGLFSIHIRATDRFSNNTPSQVIWQGFIDTLAPRLVSQPVLGRSGETTNRVSVTDFSLSEEHFSSACGAGVINERGDYTSAWYGTIDNQVAGDQARLHTLSAECAAADLAQSIYACDQFGHCVGSAPTPQPAPTVTPTPLPIEGDLDSDSDTIADRVECEGKPTCRDVDNDSHYNQHDIDSDGDSLVDKLEAIVGLTATVENAGVMLVEHPVDSDLDTIPNYLDSDSDNDFVSDLVEATDFNQDGVPDVTPSGEDSDQDGLDDAFDNVPGGTGAENAGGSTISLPDRDKDGRPDHLVADPGKIVGRVYLPLISRE